MLPDIFQTDILMKSIFFISLSSSVREMQAGKKVNVLTSETLYSRDFINIYNDTNVLQQLDGWPQAFPCSL